MRRSRQKTQAADEARPAKRYAIVDDDGLVTNVALWDGETPWEPAGTLVELADDSPVSPGDTLNPDGTITCPEPPPVDAALVDAVAVLDRIQDPDQADPPQKTINAALATIAAALLDQ